MYVNWNLRSELSFRHIKWFDVNDIVECAQFYRKRLFASGDGVIIQDFYLRHTSPKVVPFARDERFPSNKLYISHGFGDWGKHLHNFFLVASILAHHSKLNRAYKGAETLGDAELSMISFINTILEKIENFEDVFDQDKFEKTFKLKWEECTE